MHRMLAMVLLVGPCLAQPAFEAASIKPEPFSGQGSIGIRTVGDRLVVDHQSLSDMVVYAYGLDEFQVSGGPAWTRARPMDADAYQVIAKAPGDKPPTKEQFRQMLQTLLAERFKLKVHREAKEFPAYELTVGKNGHKLMPSAESNNHTVWQSGRVSKYHAKGLPIRDLAFVLHTQTGRPVIDKTGLSGRFDFELEWAEGNPPPPDVEAPSIFTAVQEQLGLKLESVKAPFDTIVIDSAERPSEN